MRSNFSHVEEMFNGDGKGWGGLTDHIPNQENSIARLSLLPMKTLSPWVVSGR